MLERYAKAHPKRLRWEGHEQMSQAETLNRGFEMARGELIGYLNSDDLFLPGAVTKLATLLVENPDAVLAYPAYRVIDEDGEAIADMAPPDYTAAEAVRLHNCIVNVGAIFRRRVIEGVGGWTRASSTSLLRLVRPRLLGRPLPPPPRGLGLLAKPSGIRQLRAGPRGRPVQMLGRWTRSTPRTI